MDGMLTHGYLFIGDYPEMTEEEYLESQRLKDEADIRKWEEKHDE